MYIRWLHRASTIDPIGLRLRYLYNSFLKNWDYVIFFFVLSLFFSLFFFFKYHRLNTIDLRFQVKRKIIQIPLTMIYQRV